MKIEQKLEVYHPLGIGLVFAYKVPIGGTEDMAQAFLN